MSIPKVEALSGAYILQWADEGVHIQATRLSDERDGLKAELTISAQNGHGLAHLHRGRLNLLSTTSKASLIKLLDNQWPSGVRWLEIIEQTCMEVMDRHRKGEPAVQLSTVKPQDSLRYRLWPLLVEKRLNLIYGEGGSGKTYLAALIALMVSEGYSELGWMPEPGPVLYLDWETTAEEIKERINALKHGLGYSGDENIYYKRCYQGIGGELPEIQSLVLQHGIQLVIVDSVGAAIGDEPDKNASAIKLAMGLRSLNVTTLTVDHVTRESAKDKSGSHQAFGGVYKMNYARWAWEIKRVQEEGEDKINIGLFHTKYNNSRKLKPIGLSMIFANEGEGPDEHVTSVLVSRAELANTPLAENLTLASRIYHVLQDTRTPMSVQALSEELEVDGTLIRTTLNRGKRMFARQPDVGGRESLWSLVDTTHV